MAGRFPVKIRVSGEQREYGTDTVLSRTEEEHEGACAEAAGKQHIIYTGSEGAKTHLVVSETCLEVRRHGPVEADMVFTCGGDREVLYRTEAGSLAFTLHTASLAVQREGGSLLVEAAYTLGSGGAVITENYMKIAVRGC